MSTSSDFTPVADLDSDIFPYTQPVVMDEDYFMDTSSAVFRVCV
jgi:hypothetical protein